MNNTKKCPKCNTENPMPASFCRHCRYLFPEETKNGQSLKPNISFFRIRENEYFVGSTVHLEWEVTNFTRIEISGEDITACKDIELYIDKERVIQLLAINDYDQQQMNLEVRPQTSPQITLFKAGNTSIKSGQTVKLSWNVIHTNQIILSDSENIKDVTNQTEFFVIPTKNVTYSIICYASDKKVFVEKALSIEVLSDVVIKVFKSSSINAIESNPITLSWNTEHADRIILYPDNIDVSGITSITMCPKRTTTYQLAAINKLSSQNEYVTVYVRQLPKLELNMDNVLSELHIPDINNIDLGSIIDSPQINGISGMLLESSKETNRIINSGIFRKLKKILKFNEKR